LVFILGNAAPGQNNIIDGLLKYQSIRRNTVLVGLMNGTDGIDEENLTAIDEESFAPYRNLGGCDYLGKSDVRLLSTKFEKLGELCQKHSITGLIMVGATHTMTDASLLTEYFLQKTIKTNVIAIPATLDGNIRHGFFECSIGFDTATKVYA
jgi:6-phosphofructokinase